ncbi:MAG: DUF115 domain-containing protein [Burkholderiales bacterium]|nr:DUF115 domain-containing protein [Burkholderiales bacterium]
MNTDDPYEVYALNLGLLQSKNPKLAELLDDVDIDGIHHQTVVGKSCTIAIDGRQLTSRHDPEAEAALRCASLNQTETVDIYGFECGYATRHLLSNYPDVKHIHVHVLNLSVFKLVLHLGPLDDVFSSARVHIFYGENPNPMLGRYLTNPAELTFTDDVNWKIRDQLLYRNLIEYSNKLFRKKWVSDTLDQDKAARLSSSNGVADLFKTIPGKHVYVIGAGPTLEKNVSRLSSILSIDKDCLVIACDTSVNGLIKHGIKPHYIVTTDPNIAPKYIDPDAAEGVSLIYGINTPAEFVENWPGPTYFYLPSVEEYTKFTDLIPKGRLFGGGSVIHPATDLAVKMGAGSITFIGADFAFPYGKTHSFWENGDLGTHIMGRHWVMNGRGEKITTNTNFAYYLIALEYLVGISTSTAFFNASPDGAAIAGVDPDPTFGDI